MPNVKTQLIVLPLVCSALLVGCNSTPTAQAPTDPATAGERATGQAESFTFHGDQYPLVYEAAVDVLHDHGFRVARNDYRFGVITTHPKEAPTAVEFWIDDPTTPAQHRADTLNAHQRSVKLQIQHAPFDLDKAVNSGKHDSSPTTYQLSVEVEVDRLQRPARYLTHSATTRISADYAAVPTHLRDRGIDGDYAQPLTRDPQLEARLMNAIAIKARKLAKSEALSPAESVQEISE